MFQFLSAPGALILTLLLSPQVDPISDADRTRAQKRYREGEDKMGKELFEEAAREFKAAIALNPRFMLAHYSLGQTYMALKRYPEAIDSYIACREAVLAQSSLSQKERADADRQRRDEINELQNSISRLSSMRGESNGVQQRLAMEQRIRFLQEANMKDADQQVRIPAEVSLALGSAYFRMGQIEDAEREYRAAIATNDELGEAHNNLAFICMKTGRLEEAKAELKAAEKAGFRVHPQFKKDIDKLLEEAKKKD